jgi:hypothetical protein
MRFDNAHAVRRLTALFDVLAKGMRQGTLARAA